MGKIYDFLSSQATRANVDMTQDATKEFFEKLKAIEIDLPEPVEKVIGAQFITIKDAKNNFAEIKNHYTSQALDAVDKMVKQQIEENELPKELVDAINAEPSSYKRVSMLNSAVKELTLKKATAGKPDQAAIAAQITQLNEAVRAEKAARENDKKEFENERKGIRKAYYVDDLFAPHKTVFDNLDRSVRNTTLRTALEKSLQDNNAKIDVDDKGDFILMRKDGTPYYTAANVVMNANQFTEQLLAGQKLLVTNNSQATGGNNGNSAGGNANGRDNNSGNGNSANGSNNGQRSQNAASNFNRQQAEALAKAGV